MAFLTALGTLATVAKGVGAVAGAVGAVKSLTSKPSAPSAPSGSVNSSTPTSNPQTGQVDIAALDQITRDMAVKNAEQSAALEQRLNPEVASLRKQSIESLQQDLGPDAYDQTLRQGLLSDFNNVRPTGVSGQSQLSQDAYNQAAQNLAMGGAIPQDVQNMLTRRAAAQSGRVGGGLELGRDITARDLGLTSLDLMNNRLNTAQSFGAQTDQFNLSADQLRAQQQQAALNERLQSAGLVANIGNADATRRLAIANLTQGINQPITGLDPGAAAAVSIGNVNALQAYLANQQELQAQQQNAKNSATGNLIGQLPGAISAVGGLFKGGSSTPSYSMPSFNTSLGSLPSYTPSFSSPSIYANSAAMPVAGALPSFNYSSAFPTTTGQYGSVFTPQFTASSPSFPCWIARAAYGICNPRWMEFRSWLIHDAPSIVRKAYIRFGPRIGDWLHRNPSFKPSVRFVMDAILANRKVSHG